MSKLLAANILNPIDILHLLPLMEDKKKAQVFERSLGVHPIYVPSNLGGSLTVGFGTQHKSPENALAVVDPEGNLHRADSSGKVILDIPSGNRRNNGPFLANVHAPSGRYSIYALFEDLGFACEADGSPLIPWNFWYFPYGNAWREKSAWGSSVMHPLEKYEKAFGVRGARKWEKKNHSDPTGGGESWEGHCHNAAPASVLFEAPPEGGLVHNGVHFTCEELKYYAVEFFGTYGVTKDRWWLPGLDEKDEDPHGRLDDYQRLRPSDDPWLFGTHPKVLVGFLNTLRETIRDRGEALIMDLRDATGASDAEVWNQAVYQYVVRYWQTDRTDLQLVEGLVVLCANGDFMNDDGSATGLPASVKIVDGEIGVMPNDTGRIQSCRFRVRFKNDGAPDANSPDNRWWNVKVGDQSIHAPRFAGFVTSPNDEPPFFAEPTIDGNPHIQREHVFELLKIRRRYL